MQNLKKLHLRIGLTYLLIVLVIFSTATSAIAQKPILRLNIGHTEPITQLYLSNDGSLLFSCGVDNTVKIWDVRTGQEIKTFKETGRPFAVSPDEKMLVLAKPENTIILLDIESERVLKSFEGHKKSITSIAFNPKGKTFATCSYDKQVIIWDVETGKALKTLKGHKMEVYEIEYSPDGKRIASVSHDQTIKLWDAETGKEIRTFTGHTYAVKSVTISSDGKRIASSGVDDLIKIWDIETGREIISIPNSWNGSIAFSPNGKYVVTGSNDKLVKIYDIETGKKIQTFSGHIKDVNTVIFSHNGKNIISGGSDKSIRFWNFDTGKEIKTLGVQRTSRVEDVKFSSDGKKIITCGDKTIKIWDITTGQQARVLKGHNSYVRAIDISRDGKKIVSGGSDKSIRIWNAESGVELKSISHVQDITELAFSPDGKRFAIASDDINPKIFDAVTGSEIKSFKGQTGIIQAIAYSPDGKNIVSASFDNSVKIWDIETGNSIKNLSGYKDGVITLAYSPDGSTIASGDERVIIWDAKSGNLIRKSKGEKCDVWSIAYSPNGKQIVSGCMDYNARIWNVETGDELKTLKGHTSIVYSVAYSPDSKWVITGSDDHTSKIWKVETGEEVLTMISFIDGNWVVYSPDGRFDGSTEGIKLLHFVIGNEIIPLESFFEQYFTPGLLGLVLAGEVYKPTEFSISNIKPKPNVKITPPQCTDPSCTVSNPVFTVNVQVTDQGGGIDEIRIYHNGKLLEGTTRGLKLFGQNYQFTINLTDGDNTIKATAFNSQRTEAIPDEITVRYKAPQVIKPNMYVLAIGVNSYLNPKYNLNYAKNDADAFISTLKKGALTLFGNVETITINDANATKTKILQAIESIKLKIKAEDVFVFYYAGHGVMSAGTDAEKPLFYLIPHDVTKMYEADEMLKKLGISANEIGEFSKNIKAQKQLFVIDACQSGGAMQTLAMRGAAEEKAIAQLARSTGTYFIAASGTEQFATEVAELGHGVFTYAVIEALKGSCKSQDGRVTVNLLKSCVEDLVPELSKKHKGQPQFPTGYGFGMDFPIVIVK
jgi:WD40 repeat protein